MHLILLTGISVKDACPIMYNFRDSEYLSRSRFTTDTHNNHTTRFDTEI